MFFLTAVIFLGGCGAMDGILPSAGTYKVNARVNGVSLDDCSLVSLNDSIRPYFEDDVSDDPDVTGLMVFLKDSRGEVVGWKVLYNLVPDPDDEDKPREREQSDSGTTGQNNTQENTSGEDLTSNSENETEEMDSTEEEESLLAEKNEDTEETAADPVEVVNEPPRQSTAEYRNGDELIITVKSLDGNLPLFPVPDNLPLGWYTLVSQVMSEKEVLQKTEKLFFFLADTEFSFENIQVHLPGTAANSQLIPNGTVIMLEALLKFDSRLDPYIVWYSGKKKVAEGNLSEGAGTLLWKAPEQNGFFSLRAEVFPAAVRQGITGFINDISLLVSSKAAYLHLIPEDTPDLIRWYVFDGDLNDSKSKTDEERALKPSGKNSPQWMPSNGTFGLVTGFGNAFTLPKVSSSESETNTWQILFRFKPLSNGRILAVQFGSSDAIMNLSREKNNLVFTLFSSSETVSESFALPESDAPITAAIVFSALPKKIIAKLNIIDNLPKQDEAVSEPISLNAELDAGYKITLGYQPEINTSENNQGAAAQRPTFTAFWDELALFSMPPVEVEDETSETEEQELPLAEEQPVSSDESAS